MMFNTGVAGASRVYCDLLHERLGLWAELLERIGWQT